MLIRQPVTDNPSLFSQVNASLFPCELSKECLTLAEEAVEDAVKAWGEKALPELEAEDRLSYACERVSNNDGSLNLAMNEEIYSLSDERGYISFRSHCNE